MKRIFGSAIFLVLIIAIFTSCGLQVPRPEVKSEEFNFSVTYEFNGEIKTVSGVYVCEYEGTDWALDGGYYREWNGYIKGGEMEDLIEIGTTKDGGKVSLNLAFYPEYFMDDPLTGGKDVPVPYISVAITDGEGMSILYDPEDVEAYCGAKIIDYEYDAPIENSFGAFK